MSGCLIPTTAVRPSTILIVNKYGIAKVVTRDSSSYLLRNIFFVPNLRINLISIRRLYKDRIKGYFNNKNIYFKKDRKTLIYT